MARFTIALTVLLASTSLYAGEVWVLHGGAGGACNQVRWTADTLFLNSTAGPAVIRLLGVSDGPDDVVQREITIAPNKLTSMSGTVAFVWRPSSGAQSFVLHLDVPDGVQVDNVLNVGLGDCTTGLPQPDTSARLGSIHLPTFRSLIAAGQTRYVVGTDLGSLNARTNVGVFNAGSEAALVDTQLLRGCDGQLLDRATFTLAPNTSRQVSLNVAAVGACTARPVQEWVNYVAINVSQPSLSYVANVVNGELPRVFLAVQ